MPELLVTIILFNEYHRLYIGYESTIGAIHAIQGLNNFIIALRIGYAILATKELL
jgi:hypothetical protein